MTKIFRLLRVTKKALVKKINNCEANDDLFIYYKLINKINKLILSF